MNEYELLNLYKEKLLSEEKSENTIKTYFKHIEDFLNQLNKSFLEVKPIEIRMFLNSKKVSSSTKNLILSSINSFFCFLKEDMEILDKNPCDKIKSLKIKDNQEKTPLNQEQIHWLIDSCKNDRDKAIITTLANTGLRISELLNITLSDYSYAKSHQGEMQIVGKGNKSRLIYLNNNTIKTIDKYLLVRKESQFNNLFISNGGKEMDRSCISRTLKTIARRSKKFSEEEINKLHNHLLRHSFVSNAVESNIPIEVVSSLVGHSNINTTFSVYLHINKNKLKDSVEKLAI